MERMRVKCKMGINDIDEFKEIVWDLFKDRFVDNGYPKIQDININTALIGKGLIDSLDLLNLATTLQEKNVYLDLSVSEGEIDTSIFGLFSMSAQNWIFSSILPLNWDLQVENGI